MRICLIILFIFLFSCKSRKIYVPVETVRLEYTDKLMVDSVYQHDSVFVFSTGDTLYVDRYKYLYRDRYVRDSIFVNDTIRVPYPEMEIKEVNKLSSLQNFQVWCGRIFLLLILIYLFYKIKFSA
ncbi:hypothetical protein [Dysgonomonas sp. 520]|uniref:hypothetical protein n=1 Tax=Dysgonomonas sp. 520 TaxID=2302931 RepID=UPI0013D1F01B|nr:hypothetical protein [Dysgonomonas sp. 520]NDW10140.1 hypothetical protein [Dysgonomonas sp. 520]